jgi:hypothetical protein
MTTSRYWTAQQVIDQAAIELGLGAPGSGIYSSTDANAILLRSLLNTAGQELALMHEWPALVKEHTITCAGGDTGYYSLPTDFAGMSDAETAWDRSAIFPMDPLTGADWQWLQADGNPMTWVQYRIVNDQFWTSPTPPDAGTVLAFEYRSRYWARATASASPDKATCTVSTDVVYFEPVLIVSLLKLRFQQARGYDTTGSLLEFERRYDAAASAHIAAPTLSLTGPRV